MGLLANVAIPTVAGHIVVMVVLLIPVALIEAVVLSQRHGLGYGESIGLSLRANVRSTFVGLPMGYVFALAGIIPAGIFAGLLPGSVRSPIQAILLSAVLAGGVHPSNAQLASVALLLGTLLAMIPYFLITLRIERQVIVKHRPDLDSPRLQATVRIMHDITYGCLLLLVIAATFHQWMQLPSDT